MKEHTMANYRLNGTHTGDMVWKPSESTGGAVSNGVIYDIVDRTVKNVDSLLVDHIVDQNGQGQNLPDSEGSITAQRGEASRNEADE